MPMAPYRFCMLFIIKKRESEIELAFPGFRPVTAGPWMLEGRFPQLQGNYKGSIVDCGCGRKCRWT